MINNRSVHVVDAARFRVHVPAMSGGYEVRTSQSMCEKVLGFEGVKQRFLEGDYLRGLLSSGMAGFLWVLKIDSGRSDLFLGRVRFFMHVSSKFGKPSWSVTTMDELCAAYVSLRGILLARYRRMMARRQIEATKKLVVSENSDISVVAPVSEPASEVVPELESDRGVAVESVPFLAACGSEFPLVTVGAAGVVSRIDAGQRLRLTKMGVSLVDEGPQITLLIPTAMQSGQVLDIILQRVFEYRAREYGLETEGFGRFGSYCGYYDHVFMHLHSRDSPPDFNPFPYGFCYLFLFQRRDWISIFTAIDSPILTDRTFRHLRSKGFQLSSHVSYRKFYDHFYHLADPAYAMDDRSFTCIETAIFVRYLFLDGRLKSSDVYSLVGKLVDSSGVDIPPVPVVKKEKASVSPTHGEIYCFLLLFFVILLVVVVVILAFLSSGKFSVPVHVPSGA